MYHEGDLIHVHPGTYGLDGTVNLTDTVHITGIGDSNRILGEFCHEMRGGWGGVITCTMDYILN